ncbi:MAG: SMP-30/gluconolactonase/LRE family protein [Bacteroidota bacterium]
MTNFQAYSSPKLSSISILILLLLQACSIQPLSWRPAPKPAFEGPLELNQDLRASEAISLDGWAGAEDIVMDQDGNLYCGVHRSPDDFSDGKILQISPEGHVEIFYDAGSWVAGLHFDSADNLIALSHREGLIQIHPDKSVTVLATQDEFGRPFLIPNGLDIASDGRIYFSNTSHESAYHIQYGRQLILEHKPQGGLHRYDPHTGEIHTLIDGTYFGNGVVLSQDEEYLLMTETTSYRILRYWLKGEQAGQTEIFMDNLPGFPNGISIREDGSYWVGFTTVRNDALDKIHPRKAMKKLVYALPDFLQPKAEAFGMVLQISPDGDILQALFDPTGEIVPEAGAVKEYRGRLYIGGDVVEHISALSLREYSSKQTFASPASDK